MTESTTRSNSNSNVICVLESPHIMGGNVPLAIGKNHSSWFLCYARPVGQSSIRIQSSLNFLDTSKPSTFLKPSTEPSAQAADATENFPRFVLYEDCPMGTGSIYRDLMSLCDSDGNKVIKNTGLKVGKRKVMEIQIPSQGILKCCAKCGKWEGIHAARFSRCSRCLCTYYCSPACQKADWKKELHKGDCALLKEGNELEVEKRRGLHDNDYDMTSRFGAMGKPTYYYDEADEIGDVDYMVHGVKTPLPTKEERLRSRMAMPGMDIF